MAGTRKREAVTAIFWIFLGLIISIWSATFPFGSQESPGPAIFPLASGLILILLGCIRFFQTRTQKEGSPLRPFEPLIPGGAGFWRIAFTIGGMLLSAALLEYLGFVLTVFFLILSLERAIQPQKWRTDVFYALVSALGSLIVFQVLLKTSLPRGFLGF
jgi:hypothetical protein